MLESQYNIILAGWIINFAIQCIFSEIPIWKTDRVGREYNASIFLVTPLFVINLLFAILLAFECFHIEQIRVMGYTTIGNNVTYNLSTYVYEYWHFYPYIFFVMGIINALIWLKMLFQFIVDATDESKYKDTNPDQDY